jgi:hypothetical protein
MKHLITLTFSLLIGSQVQAAKFEIMPTAKSLDMNQQLISNLCQSLVETNIDCGVNAYKIVSKKPSETYEKIVKQIVYATGNGYVESVRISALSKDNDAKSVFSALDYQLEVAGYNSDRPEDYSNDVLENIDGITERFSNDVDNSNYIYLAGSLSGAFSLGHSLLVVINTKTNEVLIWNAGYSE